MLEKRSGPMAPHTAAVLARLWGVYIAHVFLVSSLPFGGLSPCSSLQAELEMLLTLKVGWLKLDPLGELLPLHPDPADFIGGMEAFKQNVWSSVLSERNLWVRQLISSWIVSPVPVVRVDVIESTGGRVSRNKIFLEKTSGFKMLFGPDTFEQQKKTNKGVLSVQSGSSLKTCAVCYRQFDEVSQAFKPAFKARTVSSAML